MLTLLIVQMVIEIILFIKFSWNLWYVKAATHSIITTVSKALFYLLFCELYAMKYIIKTQENRKVEEILFDHNNEPIS